MTAAECSTESPLLVSSPPVMMATLSFKPLMFSFRAAGRDSRRGCKWNLRPRHAIHVFVAAHNLAFFQAKYHRERHVLGLSAAADLDIGQTLLKYSTLERRQ